MNLALNLTRAAARRPDGLALVCGGNQMSYAASVGLALPNGSGSAIAHSAILRPRGMAVPRDVWLLDRLGLGLTAPAEARS
jgi:hypothetical protein